MKEAQSPSRLARFAGSAIVAMRWLALLVTLFLSLHHWMRDGYWEFSGVWQYGLPLLDPRFAAALVWWLLSAAFWILVALPAASWLAEQLPVRTRERRIALLVLACGLGTRGVVGPLILRAAFGSPLMLLRPGASPVSALDNPYVARWLVLFAQAWWVLPFLSVALWLLGPRALSQSSVRWAVRGLLALFALCQPLDAAYLLTAGGPKGATQSILLLAFQEGFGRQEFGYASVLTVLLCVAVLPLASLLRVPPTGMPLASAPPSGVRSHAAGRIWPALAVAVLLPLIPAWIQNPAKLSLPPGAWPAATVSLILAVMSGLWSGFLGGALTAKSDRQPRLVTVLTRNSALLFPATVLILPMIRPWGYRTGLSEVVVLVLGMVVVAPHLVLSTMTNELLQRWGSPVSVAARVAGFVVAWAVWTELGIDVMLSQSQHALLPLQGWILWELSTALRASPLSVPGWTLAWVGGTLLAWLALDQLFRAATSSANFSDQSPSRSH